MGYFRFSVQRLVEKKRFLEEKLKKETRKEQIKQIESKIIELDKKIEPKIFWRSDMGTYKKQNVEKAEKKIEQLKSLAISVLKKQAREKGIKGYSKMTKEELINAIKEFENARN